MMMRRSTSLAVLAASLLNAAYAGEPRELNLSLPKDFYEKKTDDKDQLLLIRGASSTHNQYAKEYVQKVINSIAAIMQANGKVLDSNGEAVCSDANIAYTAVIRTSGELEGFQLWRTDNYNSTYSDIRVFSAVEKAVRNEVRLDPFDKNYFGGRDRFVLEMPYKANCIKQRKYIQLPPINLRK